VDLQVNWQTVATLPAGAIPDAWGPTTILPIPASFLNADRSNVIAFVPSTRPAWPDWGVRNVTLGP
jgi:hypothetical protein